MKCFPIQYQQPLIVFTVCFNDLYFWLYSLCISNTALLNSKKVYTHDLQMRWRACGNGWVGCSRRPTCARRPRQYPASRHWPLCCRTSLSGSRWRCCRHTRPRSSSCTHLSAPSGTRGSEGISAGMNQHLTNASARFYKMLTRTGQERIQQFAQKDLSSAENTATVWSDTNGTVLIYGDCLLRITTTKLLAFSLKITKKVGPHNSNDLSSCFVIIHSSAKFFREFF